MSFTILPVFIVGPIAGAYVDRWDRRKTLFVCDFLRSMLVITIPTIFIFWKSLIPVYVIVFLIFCLSRFYVPAKMSIIPDLVHEKSLLSANSLVSVTGMIAFVLGCAFGGILVEKFGADGGFWWGAGTFFVSGLLVLSMNTVMKVHVDGKRILEEGKKIISTIQKSLIEEITEGFVYFFKHREIRLVTSMLFILFAAAGSIYVVIIVFIQESFQTLTRDLGFLAVILGLGLFFGSILYGRFGQRMSRFKLIFICLMLGGVAMIGFAIVVQHIREFTVAGALAFLLGLIIGPVFIAANTLVHEVSLDEMRGRVFSALEAVMHLGFLLAMFFSAFLSDTLGVEHFRILIGVGITFSLVGAVGFLMYSLKKEALFKEARV